MNAIDISPDLDRAARYCANFSTANPGALATALLDCRLTAEDGSQLAAEHGHDREAIRSHMAPKNQDAPESLPAPEAPATEAATDDCEEDTTPESHTQDLRAPTGAIFVVRNWEQHTVPATAEALAQWCRDNRAPDVKPEGDSNAPNLGFLIGLVEDCSGTGHPKIEDVAFTCGASFDLDKITREQIFETLSRTQRAGHAAVFWESHSSTEAEPKGRLLVVFDPPCPADEHPAVYKQLQSELCPWAPKAQHNVNRGWNPPRASAEVEELPGTPVNWRDVIARAPAAPKPERKAANGAPKGPAIIGPANLETAIRMCETHPPGTEDGNASANLLALGCKLILACGLDLETAVVTALRHYDPRCVNEAGELFPWGEAEIRRAFARAATKEPSKSQQKWRETLDAVIAPDDPASDAAPEAPPAKCWKVTSAVALCEPLPPVPWLCKALDLAPGRTAVISGSASSGKTMGAMDLALSVASGKPVFGDARFAVRQGSVLHVDVDQGAYPTRRRYQQMAAGRGLDLATLPLDCIFWQVRLTAPGLAQGNIDPEAVYALRDHCADKTLCIVDSLRGVAPDMNENSSEFGVVLQVMTEIADQTGCTFLLIHHDGHNGRFRGTTAIRDRAGAFWQATREDGRVTWTVQKPSEFSLGTAPEFSTALDHLDHNPEVEGHPFRIRVLPDGASVAAPKGSAVRSQRDQDKRAILSYLDGTVREFASTAEITGYFNGEDGRPGIGKHRIEDALRELVTERKVERVKSGKNVTYRRGAGGQITMAKDPAGGWQAN